MARQCSVCTHKDRDKIDKALVEHDTSYRHLASRFDLSLSAVYRHARNHIPETLTKAEHVKDVASADKLLARIEALIGEAEGLLEFGKSEKQGRDWKGGLQELRKCFELLARVTGVLDEKPEINIISHPQWIQLRTDLIQILGDYPEVKKKVLEAFNAHGDAGS